MKEMKTQLILFSLLLLGSTAWAQQPCLSQEAYREKVEAYSQILKQQKLKTLASSEARKIAHTGFLPKIDVNADGTLNMSDLSAWNEPVGEYRNHTYQGICRITATLHRRCAQCPTSDSEGRRKAEPAERGTHVRPDSLSKRCCLLECLRFKSHATSGRQIPEHCQTAI